MLRLVIYLICKMWCNVIFHKDLVQMKLVLFVHNSSHYNNDKGSFHSYMQLLLIDIRLMRIVNLFGFQTFIWDATETQQSRHTQLTSQTYSNTNFIITIKSFNHNHTCYFQYIHDIQFGFMLQIPYTCTCYIFQQGGQSFLTSLTSWIEHGVFLTGARCF